MILQCLLCKSCICDRNQTYVKFWKFNSKIWFSKTGTDLSKPLLLSFPGYCQVHQKSKNTGWLLDWWPYLGINSFRDCFAGKAQTPQYCQGKYHLYPLPMLFNGWYRRETLEIKMDSTQCSSNKYKSYWLKIDSQYSD